MAVTYPPELVLVRISLKNRIKNVVTEFPTLVNLH